ncbi:Arc/MetJ-type ribon-helix-helix transcriptional regulator [Rhizobium sp. BK619]|uniref:Arc/MetJ-type ribon-helix-helix transcriptional regulator n=1 Tax=Rhizobium leguminosarum TaxID=384 RepID=A0A7W9ZSP1_RHILE|nr:MULTISPECIES: transcriptional regulator [Rhizobium]MBB3646880.1 Arc/MetJ-type ribon-helix-helix transcriptional regulator [Rhizobium sp. BK619]MBB6222093.1 Arc/MetJ-type ribon-helix-helix transcriptional regulator [Rhizobium leguminosarum]
MLRYTQLKKVKDPPIASGSIHVKVSGALQDHIQQQIGDGGLYENASEYIRALIRRDLQTRDEAWDVLQKELAPAMRAADSEFITVTAEDVIGRNKRR